jgi:hypothetical protein
MNQHSTPSEPVNPVPAVPAPQACKPCESEAWNMVEAEDIRDYADGWVL